MVLDELGRRQAGEVAVAGLEHDRQVVHALDEDRVARRVLNGDFVRDRQISSVGRGTGAALGGIDALGFTVARHEGGVIDLDVSDRNGHKALLDNKGHGLNPRCNCWQCIYHGVEAADMGSQETLQQLCGGGEKKE